MPCLLASLVTSIGFLAIPIERTPHVAVVETLTFEAVLRVDQLRFTQDDVSVSPWNLEGRSIPITIDAAVATDIHGSSGVEREYRAISIRVGDSFEIQPNLSGRTIVRSPGAVRLALRDTESEKREYWESVMDRIQYEFSPWARVWRGAPKTQLDWNDTPALHGSFSIPGGLQQFVAAPDSPFVDVVAALLEFASAPLERDATEQADAAGSMSWSSRPDGSALLRACWRSAWGGDLGTREARNVKSDLELRGRSELAIERGAQSGRAAKLRASGTSRWHGTLRFTTHADSWPSRWTCAIDATLDWKTSADWK